MASIRKIQAHTHARNLFMDGKHSQKEIASIVNVSEKTVHSWMIKENWQEIRTARLITKEQSLQNSRQAVANFGDMMIDLQNEREALMNTPEEVRDKEAIREIDQRLAGLAQSIAMTRKAYESVDKENAVGFTTYVNVMESVFKALQLEDEKLHTLTLDFQERHLQEVAKRYNA